MKKIVLFLLAGLSSLMKFLFPAFANGGYIDDDGYYPRTFYMPPPSTGALNVKGNVYDSATNELEGIKVSLITADGHTDEQFTLSNGEFYIWDYDVPRHSTNSLIAEDTNGVYSPKKYLIYMTDGFETITTNFYLEKNTNTSESNANKTNK